MVTLIANQLDNNYSQTQINAFYTQAKKLIEDPFEFIVFVQDKEYDLLMDTKKKDGYLDDIQFHVPKYGLDWIEVDIMQLTKPKSCSLFITPNVLLNNISVIETYKSNKKLRLQDGNLAYFIYRNNKIENILQQWEEEEDDLLFNFDAFHEKFLIEEGEIPFLQDTTATYPENTEGDIVILPQWYDDFTEEQIEFMYNKETDLYPYLPQKVEMELYDGEKYLTYEQVKESFNPDFMLKAKPKRIHIKSISEEDQTLNADIIDIVHYFVKEWVVSVDLDTNGLEHDPAWWKNIGTLFKELGNITFNINTGNPDIQVLENAQALIKSGVRVFWAYTHTTQLDNDIQKAKRLCKQYKFSGFVYNNEVPPEKKKLTKKKKQDMPDYKLIELETLKTRKKDDIYKERKIKFAPHIMCEGKIKNQFYLSATGNVFPCKHVATNIITAYNSPEHKTELLYDWDKNSIDNFSLEAIFTNDFYKGYFNNLLKLNPIILHNEQEGKC
tara:strand:- start:5580 stop:7070 length:1491 start_codon:yes stop_codon:yes gene_type:complete